MNVLEFVVGVTDCLSMRRLELDDEKPAIFTFQYQIASCAVVEHKGGSSHGLPCGNHLNGDSSLEAAIVAIHCNVGGALGG